MPVQAPVHHHQELARRAAAVLARMILMQQGCRDVEQARVKCTG